MSKIKVGIIGAGGISSGVHLPLLSSFLRGLNNTKELLKNYNLEVFQ